jgi:hypothetical protein
VSRRTVKKLLLSFIAIGLLASLTGGTYAVLQGSQENINSNVASGTLTLSNQVGAGTVCVSNSGSGTYATGTENDNTLQSSPASAGCTAIVTAATIQYPGTLTTVHVTVQNTGSVDGAKLYLYMYGAVAGVPTPGAGCVSTTTTSATVIGAGSPCAAAGDGFYVEEDNSLWAAQRCDYPAGAGACSIAGGGTLNDFSTQYYTYVGHKLDLGVSPTSVIALPNQGTRYFTIGIEESNDNTMQGKTATFSLTWHLDSST